MKATYLLLGLAAGLLAGCGQPPQQQAEAAVSRYVRATVHDAGSFEVVRFETQPYTRRDSVAYAARRLAQRTGLRPAVLPAVPGAQDATPVGWRVQLHYRVRNGYAPATAEQGTYVVYLPATVVPIAQ